MAAARKVCPGGRLGEGGWGWYKGCNARGRRREWGGNTLNGRLVVGSHVVGRRLLGCYHGQAKVAWEGGRGLAGKAGQNGKAGQVAEEEGRRAGGLRYGRAQGV